MTVVARGEGVRVSIVTPFLNAGRFIEECIRSVLAQTYEHWELLLVDDGSTDDSAAIALSYASAYPDRISYLAHEQRQNKGASAARNLAARHARGEYLAYLDADDVYLPHKLETQVPLLDAEQNVAMVYAATEYWNSWTGRPEDIERDWIWRKYGAPPGIVVDPPRMLVAFLRDGGTVPCMGSVLVRRAAVESVGGWEEAFQRICTDQVFHAKLCLRFRVMVADVCLDRYRQHDDSSCRTVAREGRMDAAFVTYLNWLEGYLSDQRVTDASVRAALRTALRPYRHPLLHRVEQRTMRCDSLLRAAALRTAKRALPAALRDRLRRRGR
jgi:glycosyltransferase involved in cell wall biosynthesis